jgi:hypothetical protein
LTRDPFYNKLVFGRNNLAIYFYLGIKDKFSYRIIF